MFHCLSIPILPLLAVALSLEPPDADLIERVLAGNSATVQSIESYYCNIISMNSAKDQTAISVSEYWRTKDFVQIRERRSPTLTIDVRMAGGRSQQITTSSRQPLDPSDIHITFDESRHFGLPSDAWQLSLFDLPVNITQKPPLLIYNLAEFASRGSIKESEWIRLEGAEVAHLSVELRSERRAYELWIDPKKNWMIVKLIHILKDSEGAELWRIEHKIEELREIKPSIFIPTLTSSSSRYRGKLTKERFVRFDGLRVNESLPPVPAMPIPPGGSLATDLTEGVIYRIDGNGRRTSNLFRIGAEISGLANPSTRPAERNPYRNWGWILGIASLLVAAAAFSRRFIHRRTS